MKKSGLAYLVAFALTFNLFSVTNISAESVNDLNASIVDNGIELSTESVALSQVPDNIKNLETMNL